MGLVAYKGELYGGGSDVEANPSGSETDTLTKVGIDGDIYAIEDADAVHTSDIGTANGVAELDANGLVPSSQLPSYVDDVVEYASVSAFPATGETGKIYVALDTNLTYRWSGSAYVEISPSLALGETSSTAYRGDRGKTAYDHATESGRSGAKSAGLYKIGVTAQGHVASATAVAKADLTALGVADQNDVDAIEEDIEGFKTATGKYITVTDAAALPANEYELTLSPVQSLNGYDSPWVGGAGKNKFDQDTVYSSYAQTDGSFRLTGVNADSTKNPVPSALVGKQLTFSFYADLTKETSPTAVVAVAKVNGTTTEGARIENNTKGISSVTFTPTSTSDQFWVSYGSSGQNYFTMKDLQLEESASFTTYSPYANICPIHGADEVGVRVCGVNLCDLSASYVSNPYRYIDVPLGATKELYMVLSDKDTSVNVSDILIGFTNTNANASRSYRWVLNGGTISANHSNISNAGDESGIYCPYVFMYPNTDEAWGRLNQRFNISVNYPNTDHEYHAYNGHSTTITLPSTVYGGSVEQSGNGQVTFGLIDLSTQSTWYSDAPNSYGFIRFVTPITGKASGYNMYCSSFKVSDTIIPSTATGEGISGYYANNNIYLAIDSNRLTGDLTTADGRKAALLTWLQNNTVTVAFVLATPTDISVTPFPQTLLEGVNNVWAEMKENSTVIDNAQQSLSYQPQNIVGQLRQEIEAKPDSFAQLSDTSFSNLANGQIPKWNSTTNKWENANESGGGGLPAWTKIWNYKSGATFSMPSGKTDIMLVIVLDASDTRLISNVYPVEYPFSKILNTEYFDGSDTVWMEVTTANVVNVGNNTQQPTSYFDFEIWVR